MPILLRLYKIGVLLPSAFGIALWHPIRAVPIHGRHAGLETMAF